MTPQSPPHAQAPAVQRLRVRFRKRGRLRFSSHRDFQRALERAIRRADVPVAFSQGFTPHPKVSYAGAAPTGAASEAEYLELSLTRRCHAEEIRAALDAALPDGLDVVEVVEAGPGSLADRLAASHWRVRLPGVPDTTAAAAVARFLAATSVEVQRVTKNGVRTTDVRAAVVSAVVSPAVAAEPAGRDAADGPPRRTGGPAPDPALDTGSSADAASAPCAILDLVVRHGTPSVRPDDVLAGLRRVAELVPPQPPQATRVAQGPLDEASGTVGDPLAPDRDATRPGGTASAVAPGLPSEA
jgi:radical SAM-linked protein